MKPRNAGSKKPGRSYRVLNLDPTLEPKGAPTSMPRTPVVMANGSHRWCMTEAEAIDCAAYAEAHGYRVEIVLAVD